MGSATLAILDDRCARCDCGTDRHGLLKVAAVEAARRFMAAQLRYEGRTFSSAEDRRYVLEDSLQVLRDTLDAERRARHG